MIARKYLSFLSLACLAMVAFYSTPAMACSCVYTPLRQKLCNANFVALVRVIDKYSLPDGQIVNNVVVMANYKPTTGGQHISGNIALTTPAADNSCYINLEKDKHYFVAGNGKHVNLCNFILDYETAAVDERWEIEALYTKECSGNAPQQ